MADNYYLQMLRYIALCIMQNKVPSKEIKPKLTSTPGLGGPQKSAAFALLYTGKSIEG